MSCAAQIRRGKTDMRSSWRVQICIIILLPLVLVSVAAAQPARKSPVGRLLIASDIHFNPMADPSLVADLAAADPAQWEAILQRSKPTAFSPYGQDTNWWLLRSALQAMVRAEPHPALMMFTGDLLAHDFPKTYKSITHDDDAGHYRAFVLKTVDFVALEVRQRFRGGEDLADARQQRRLLRRLHHRGEWSRSCATLRKGRATLAMEGEQFSATWKSLGSYSVEHPTLHGVRILSLNTIFWSDKYRAASFSHGCATVNSTAAGDLFTWLESQLAEAQQSTRKSLAHVSHSPGHRRLGDNPSL